MRQNQLNDTKKLKHFCLRLFSNISQHRFFKDCTKEQKASKVLFKNKFLEFNLSTVFLQKLKYYKEHYLAST